MNRVLPVWPGLFQGWLQVLRPSPPSSPRGVLRVSGQQGKAQIHPHKLLQKHFHARISPRGPSRLVRQQRTCVSHGKCTAHNAGPPGPGAAPLGDHGHARQGTGGRGGRAASEAGGAVEPGVRRDASHVELCRWRGCGLQTARMC